MAKLQAKETTDDKDGFVDELKPGTKLMHGQYTIESFLNAGGFGITYLARDSLDRKIVIKECFPGAFCRRSRYVVQARSRAHQNELKSIVRLFVQEARSLAKLDHPNIVGVHQVFEDNDTAYMALDFVEGRDLLDTIEDPNHGLTPTQIKTILKEVLGAVGFIHDQGILHRDISPDNILINQDFRPVLIDFGAAREEATKQSRVLSALRVVKDGYSPQEFYIAGSEQSPSSDLYALAASFHHLIANEVPPNSQARLAAIASGDPDPYKALVGRFPDYDNAFLAAMDKALAVLPKDRVQSAKEWIALMDGGQGNVTPLKVASAPAVEKTPAAAAPAAAKKSNMPILLGSAAAIALLIGVG
ncbi:MAG: serine/threonine protein kinase, partial [Paracoccaceae bacterium]|nr:serine/threonine protein kinase [Paracoccaceae bacterium]